MNSMTSKSKTTCTDSRGDSHTPYEQERKKGRSKLKNTHKALTEEYNRRSENIRHLKTNKEKLHDKADSHWKKDWKRRMDSNTAEKYILDKALQWVSRLDQKTISNEKLLNNLEKIKERCIKEFYKENGIPKYDYKFKRPIKEITQNHIHL